MFNLIINPTAGKSKSLRALRKTEKYLRKKNFDYQVHFTKEIGHASALAKNLQEKGENNIIILGGDGTVFEVLNGLETLENVHIGIIPCGTGNDFAKTLGLPKNPAKAMDIILQQNTRRFDLLKVNDCYSLNVAGTGLDVDVLQTAAKNKIFKGKIKYVLALIKVLFKFDFYPLTVTAEGQTFSDSFMLVSACNGQYFGGGIKVSPESSPEDGWIDLIMVSKIRKIKIPFLFLKFLKGKPIHDPAYRSLRCKSVSITSDKPMIVNTDGELHPDQPFQCSILEKAVQIFVEKK